MTTMKMTRHGSMIRNSVDIDFTMAKQTDQLTGQKHKVSARLEPTSRLRQAPGPLGMDILAILKAKPAQTLTAGNRSKSRLKSLI